MEISGWLSSKSHTFTRQVSLMGEKFNLKGNEDVVLDENGVHTGYGMCNIASAAIEEAAIKIFGSDVDVQVASLYTRVCDFAHQVVESSLRKEVGLL